jgi:hypothetical protein
MTNLRRIFLFALFSGVLGVCSLTAQSQLERISITERGDGNGYVLRYHLTEMVDSFDLIHPEINRVQMQLFSSGLEISDVDMPDLNDEITAVNLFELANGIGVDITTAENVFFIAEAYPDQNMRDLLVNFEYATRTQAEEQALESDLYEWFLPDETEAEQVVAESQQEAEDEPEPQANTGDEDQQTVVQREPVSVKIGIAGGVGFANKLGGNYTAEYRQEFVMGFSAGISLPFVLPYSIHTGLETGVYYTQKGFLNPSIDRFDGESILLDYVEIPVLLRLNYNLTDAIQPKVVGGFYTAFRANAEILQDNGDRISINDHTNTVDFGLTAGVGTDVLIESTTISLQVQYGLGIRPMFTNNFSGNERQGYFSLLMAVRF